MTECCETCRHKTKLVMYDYSFGGCKHIELDGFACLSFVNEGQTEWMVGSNPKVEKCEAYEPKEAT